MRPSTFLLPLISLIPTVYSQAAAGGGAPVVSLVASQDATVRTMPSIYTVNGVTSVTYAAFTQTFAATALGSWELGPTPRPGVIGLGDIQGEIGKPKKDGKKKRGLFERAVPTNWGW